MFRYFALISPRGGRLVQTAARALALRLEESARGSLRWSRVIDEPHLIVSCAGERAGSSEAISMREGIVLGKLFRRDESAEFDPGVTGLDELESGKVSASGGRYLIESYWGRYVAVLDNPSSGEVRVLRDPSGALPCFFTMHEGVTIVFSDIEDCLRAGVRGFTISWSYIAAFVPYSSLQVRATGLNEVSEVQAGERITFAASPQREFLWNPVHIAKGTAIESFEAAVAQLRRATRAAVFTWASAYEGLLHNLSGGLDSSIVLSALREAVKLGPLTCLHYFAPGRDEDERRYARLAADHAGVGLLEHQLEPAGLKLENILQIARSPRPWFYLHELERSDIENRLAAERGATGIFSGAGGDALFYQGRADLAVADFACLRGIGPRLLGVALDAARMERRSVWALLQAALLQRLRHASWSPLVEVMERRTLVHEQIRALPWEDMLHPWLEDAEGVVPGKVWHILSMSLAAAFYDSFGREDVPERTVPLMSQPLVELCLRIPTYFSIRDGRDRAVARAAFANDLPAAIVRRRAKGAIDHYSREVLDRNLPFVREVLLDGLLVREGILDRARLERHLTRARSPADFEYNEILHQHLCTEAWLRRWQ